MTCQDLSNYFDSDLNTDSELLRDTQAAEHIATCPECSRVFEDRRELEEYLSLIRNSAPPIPDSLDSGVVANYRLYLSEQPCSARSGLATQPIYPRAALGWIAAVAFAAVIAYGGRLLFNPRPSISVDRPGSIARPMLPEVRTTTNKETARVQTIIRRAPKSHGHSAKRPNHPATLAERSNSLPTQFRGLMYCDQISCTGAMEIIRVQLPSPVMGLTPASTRTSGSVLAEVLVGSDGVARGIRVVE